MKNKGKGLIFLGLLLIAAALFLTAFNLYDEMRAGQSARQVISRLEKYLTAEGAGEVSAEPAGEQNADHDERTTIPDYVLCPDMEMPVETVDGVDYIGVLAIPALDLELPVISQWSYPGLRTAPCRYSGSAYSDDLILAGHNYSTHFGGLKYLSEGDVVTFTDANGNEFSYTVVEREILSPNDVEEMEDGEWDLTLFTCTVGGRSRVTVRCEREQTS